MQRASTITIALQRRSTAALLSSVSCRALAPASRRYADLGGQLNKEYENYIRKERALQRELEGSDKHNVQDQAKDGERLTSPEGAESEKPLNPGGRQFGEPQPPEKVTDPKEHDLPLF
ncbi:uncharacterized protein ACA1_400510 [Acanthamoeba castellanii str. Neff]|uniref:Uncharacterized protein n=1 Tax=Acanthamoeba castellanii (strain ATCC 30010 / Neff) TaxID=1257118 RepID=L8GGV0_ACACF|nr:uncharacterized protein ACA1_400510 [Acanthamoeba castellanii str. Neff]ELR11973.1 hypothetical protein ACA1_400510 [Acanthamoeba castellanii str. Neff]